MKHSGSALRSVFQLVWPLGIFSVVVAEDDALQSDILAVWAGTMKESL